MENIINSDISTVKPTVIELKNVTLQYKLYTEKITTFKNYVRKMLKHNLKMVEFCALNDVSLKITKGDILGIIGLNGAGKSTILKVIAGVIEPTTGKVTVNGTIAPLLELGAGFDGELTGIENIFLYGTLLGISRKILEQQLDEIVEFADIGRFISQPLKNYSSGMKARLGFAICTCVVPDILIIDEALSVGDSKFRAKCEAKINEMITAGATAILVSHSMDQITRLCKRIIWMDRGEIRKDGDLEICKEYELYNPPKKKK